MYEPWHSTRSDETARLLRGHCQHFSRLGWALFAQMLSMLLAQAGILLIVGVCAPGLTGNFRTAGACASRTRRPLR